VAGDSARDDNAQVGESGRAFVDTAFADPQLEKLVREANKVVFDKGSPYAVSRSEPPESPVRDGSPSKSSDQPVPTLTDYATK